MNPTLNPQDWTERRQEIEAQERQRLDAIKRHQGQTVIVRPIVIPLIGLALAGLVLVLLRMTTTADRMSLLLPGVPTDWLLSIELVLIGVTILISGSFAMAFLAAAGGAGFILIAAAGIALASYVMLLPHWTDTVWENYEVIVAVGVFALSLTVLEKMLQAKPLTGAWVVLNLVPCGLLVLATMTWSLVLALYPLWDGALAHWPDQVAQWISALPPQLVEILAPRSPPS